MSFEKHDKGDVQTREKSIAFGVKRKVEFLDVRLMIKKTDREGRYNIIL